MTITIGAGEAGTAAGDASVNTHQFAGVNNTLGSNFADTYNASDFNGLNAFLGQGGDDTTNGDGATQIRFNNATASVVVDISAGAASGGHDILTGVKCCGSRFNDTNTGDTAENVLSGLNGNNTFVFKEATGGGIRNDVITDFVAGQGHIHLGYAAVDQSSAPTFAAWLRQHGGRSEMLIDLDSLANSGKDTILQKIVALANLHVSDFVP